MNVKNMGSDQSATNLSGGNYAATLQVTTKRSRLYKLTLSPLSGMAAAVFAWIFDTASGSGSSAGPVAVLPLAIGAGGVLDFPDGAEFTSGIYVALSTVAPTDGTTTVTTSGANKMIIKADFRQG